MKMQSRQTSRNFATSEEPRSSKTSIKVFTKIDAKITSDSINGIKGKARIRVEQDLDLVLRNLRPKVLGQPQDEVLSTTDNRFMTYKANEDRMILENGIPFRKDYGK